MIYEGEECYDIDGDVVHNECLRNMKPAEIDEFFQCDKGQYIYYFTSGEMIAEYPVECYYCGKMIMPGDEMIADGFNGNITWAIHKDDYDNRITEAELIDILELTGNDVAEMLGYHQETAVYYEGNWDD